MSQKITKKTFRSLPAASRLYRLARRYQLREEVYERALKAALQFQQKTASRKSPSQ